MLKVGLGILVLSCVCASAIDVGGKGIDWGIRKPDAGNVSFCVHDFAHKPLPLDGLLMELGRSRGITGKPDVKAAEWLLPRMKAQPGFVDKALADQWRAELKLGEDAFLTAVAEAAKSLARPPISEYFVGQGARAGSGRVYWSVNLEFPGFPLNHTVHGEQFMVSLMMLNGETVIETLALLGAPCGHCRQFLREMKHWKSMRVLMPEHPPYYLPELLPVSFGPDALGMTEALLASKPWQISLKPGLKFDPVDEEAVLRLASMSYAPYTKAPAGVVIVDKNGKSYYGMNIDNVAFNPSLSAWSVALTDLVRQGGDYADIRAVYLAEDGDPKRKQELPMVSAAIKVIAPSALLIRVPIDVKR